MLRRTQSARLLAIASRAPDTRLAIIGRREVTVGRAEGSEVKIADAEIAPRHALIRYKRGRYYVVDLKSASGSFLNDRRVRRRPRVLSHGDRLRFGAAWSYRFIDPDAASRRRNRRVVQAAIVAAIAIAGMLVHRAGWDDGMLSAASAIQVAALAQSYATSSFADISHREPSAAAAASPGSASNPTQSAAAEFSPANPSTPDRKDAPGQGPASAQSASPAASPPSPAASSGSISSSPPVAWLARINRYRAIARVGLLHEDSSVSAAAAAHSRYLLANYMGKISSGEPLGDAGHEERHGDKDYSPAGAAAAPNSQLAWGCGADDIEEQIDQWVAGPFHRLPMLDPLLSEAGFGESTDAGCWVAALRLAAPEEHPMVYPTPIEFPSDGAPVSIKWSGVEYPDPIATCPNYQMPVGLPITLQLGRLFDAQLTAHSLTEDGAAVESCAFDAHGYRNPDLAAQEYGRWALRSAGAVVLIPRNPLEPGKSYSVSIAAHGKTYAWTFRVGE
ncbi:MAG TPA: FHA domain-containing protein [Candidatus Binataceae bacterium]|nr:FHA domain-containing protein [Candidatus Binataceae bacterium]